MKCPFKGGCLYGFNQNKCQDACGVVWLIGLCVLAMAAILCVYMKEFLVLLGVMK